MTTVLAHNRPIFLSSPFPQIYTNVKNNLPESNYANSTATSCEANSPNSLTVIGLLQDIARKVSNIEVLLGASSSLSSFPTKVPSQDKGIDIVLGAQWGDEGKGKLVDILSQVRFCSFFSEVLLLRSLWFLLQDILSSYNTFYNFYFYFRVPNHSCRTMTYAPASQVDPMPVIPLWWTESNINSISCRLEF